MYSHPQTADWYVQLDLRLRNRWLTKMVGTTVAMAAFFIAYFALAHYPAFPVTVMPLTAIDHWIEFQPSALPLYLSLWAYVSLVPALLLDRRELVGYCTAAVSLGTIGLAIFFLWPTTVPQWEGGWSQDSAFRFLQSVDASGNACPSLHAAFTVFTALWLHRLLSQMRAAAAVRVVNWLWCVGIVYSTMATRQHVALDVLAGVVLGLGAGLYPWRRRAVPGILPQ